MLLAAACCPHPPVLVPDVVAGAAAELDPLRAACDTALQRLVAADPELIVLVGSGDPPGERPTGAWGTLATYGVPVTARLGGDRRPAADPGRGGDRRPAADPGRGADRDPTAGLPLSLTVGAWLLNRTPWTGPVTAYAVAESTPPDDCAAVGEALARRAGRVGIVVMGDGSARRSLAAPGYLDGRAAAFDAAVARALGGADTEALLRLDAAVAAQLLVAGRAPWQVLAGAARGGMWRSQLCYDDAPYGVGYFVASWFRAERSAHGGGPP